MGSLGKLRNLGEEFFVFLPSDPLVWWRGGGVKCTKLLVLSLFVCPDLPANSLFLVAGSPILAGRPPVSTAVKPHIVRVPIRFGGQSDFV
jgi:hypothetical protein